MPLKLTLLLLPLLSATVVTSPSSSSVCTDFLIPVNITSQHAVLDIEISDNWDVEDYIFNSTRRDSLTTFKPIIGEVNAPAEYRIGATFCTPKSKTNATGTALLLTHGSMVDRKYWNPIFDGSERYNFVQHAINRGYSVFFYDRLGNGESSTPDPIADVQFQPQVEILSILTNLLKQPHSPYTQGIEIAKIVHVGHSFGSFLTLAAITTNPENFSDAVILTGYSGVYDWLELFTSGGQARVAALSQPEKWGLFPHGYLVPVDAYAASYGGFKSPYFDHAVAQWLSKTQVPYAIGELLTASTIIPDLSLIKTPVQVVQGRYDLPACGGNCDGVLNTTVTLFPNSSRLQVTGSFNAGHMLNYHYEASSAFDLITSFLEGGL